ncbi:hypothetical protein CL86_gp043 [Mycobacterium phage SkiPole]|uniref:Uncharacterized protein n=1 Tax=Mycobacterium phage SkiPole TaxID=701456 RepID=D2XRN7_9CAUD|nr:hypothetical protein CL86_gp043 [Mycobacterium phage SkiPole]ADA83769.1 hypothetical protein SKIPOLE_43 [Mycobacterium phage SkiPole]
MIAPARTGWGQDPTKWLLYQSSYGLWQVVPPIGSFYGVITFHPDYESARADFIRQTRRP